MVTVIESQRTCPSSIRLDASRSGPLFAFLSLIYSRPLFKSTTLRVSERSSLFFLILGASIQAGHLTIPFPLNSLGNEPTHYCTVNLFNRLLVHLSKELRVEDTFNWCIANMRELLFIARSFPS